MRRTGKKSGNGGKALAECAAVRNPRGKLKTMLEHLTIAPYDGVTHPCDVRRFYRFIRYAHAHGSTLSPDDVEFHLRRIGFQPAEATRLAKHYAIGRRVLCCHWTAGANWWNPWERRTVNDDPDPSSSDDGRG